MPEKERKKNLWIFAAAVVLILFGAIVFFSLYSPERNQVQPGSQARGGDAESSGAAHSISVDRDKAPENGQSYKDTVPADDSADEYGSQGKEVIEIPSIDYKSLDKETGLGKMMKQRKKEVGISDSVDLIVRSDESFIVGGQKISMEKIIERAAMKRGDVHEAEIEGSDTQTDDSAREYGVYVVQPGDNVWNIHFDIIKDYYSSRGISVEPKADEPDDSGMSSGVGKILKFSEKTVIIYNLAEDKIDTNIDLIQPLSKIVVYDLSRVFTLLEQISYENVDRVKFDGTTLWISSDES